MSEFAMSRGAAQSPDHLLSADTLMYPSNYVIIHFCVTFVWK